MNLPNGSPVPSAQQIADSATFTIIARGAMVVSTAILPIAGFAGYLLLKSIDDKAQETLEQVNALASESRRSSDSIIQLSGELNTIRQKDSDQDRRLDVVDSRIDRLSLYSNRRMISP